MAQVPASLLTGFDPSTEFSFKSDTQNRLNRLYSNLNAPAPVYPTYNTPETTINGMLKGETPFNLKEAYFSEDANQRQLADEILSKKMSEDLAYTMGVNTPQYFDYNKSLDKYLRGDLGYDPLSSRAENEARYYDAQSTFGRIGGNTLKFFGRTLGGAVLKFGEGIGYLGSIINPTNWNEDFITSVADNGFSRFLEDAEQSFKDTVLPVYHSLDYDKKGIFSKMLDSSWWADSVSDGAAFLLSAAIPGVGLAGRGAQLTGKAGKVAKFLTGADKLGGVGAFALNTASESFFEAAASLRQYEEEQKQLRLEGKHNKSDEQIRQEASKIAANVFYGNVAILGLVSNKFENAMIFNKIANKVRPGVASDLVNIGEDLTASIRGNRASRLLTNLSTNRLGFYGGQGLKATAIEGLWEENAQLGVQRLAAQNELNPANLAMQMAKQIKGALAGTDPEAAESIVLGGILGTFGTGAASKIANERKIKKETLSKAEGIVKNLNEMRGRFLSLDDIYERDENGVVFENGEPKVKVESIAAKVKMMETFLNMQEQIEQASDPDIKQLLSKNLLKEYVRANIESGTYNKFIKRFENIANQDPQVVQDFGFDPTSFKGNPQELVQYAQSVAEGYAYSRMLNTENSSKDLFFDKYVQNLNLREYLDNLETYSQDYQAKYRTIDNAVLGDVFAEKYNNLQFRIEALTQVQNQSPTSFRKELLDTLKEEQRILTESEEFSADGLDKTEDGYYINQKQLYTLDYPEYLYTQKKKAEVENIMTENNYLLNNILNPKVAEEALKEAATQAVAANMPSELAPEIQAPQATPSVEQSEFENFVNTGEVSEETTDKIADKIEKNEPLTEQEIAIYSEKSNDVEKKLEKKKREKQVVEETKTPNAPSNVPAEPVEKLDYNYIGKVAYLTPLKTITGESTIVEGEEIAKTDDAYRTWVQKYLTSKLFEDVGAYPNTGKYKLFMMLDRAEWTYNKSKGYDGLLGGIVVVTDQEGNPIYFDESYNPVTPESGKVISYSIDTNYTNRQFLQKAGVAFNKGMLINGKLIKLKDIETVKKSYIAIHSDMINRKNSVTDGSKVELVLTTVQANNDVPVGPVREAQEVFGENPNMTIINGKVYMEIEGTKYPVNPKYFYKMKSLVKTMENLYSGTYNEQEAKEIIAFMSSVLPMSSRGKGFKSFSIVPTENGEFTIQAKYSGEILSPAKFSEKLNKTYTPYAIKVANIGLEEPFTYFDESGKKITKPYKDFLKDKFETDLLGTKQQDGSYTFRPLNAYLTFEFADNVNKEISNELVTDIPTQAGNVVVSNESALVVSKTTKPQPASNPNPVVNKEVRKKNNQTNPAQPTVPTQEAPKIEVTPPVQNEVETFLGFKKGDKIVSDSGSTYTITRITPEKVEFLQTNTNTKGEWNNEAFENYLTNNRIWREGNEPKTIKKAVKVTPKKEVISTPPPTVLEVQAPVQRVVPTTAPTKADKFVSLRVSPTEQLGTFKIYADEDIRKQIGYIDTLREKIRALYVEQANLNKGLDSIDLRGKSIDEIMKMGSPQTMIDGEYKPAELSSLNKSILRFKASMAAIFGFDIEVITNTEEIDTLKETEPAFEQAKKVPIFGFVFANKIYIDPRYAIESTPIHEFAHLWNNIMKVNLPDFYYRGLNLIKDTVYETRVRNLYNALGRNISEEGILEEALTRAIEDRGMELDKQKNKSLINWLKNLWRLIGERLNFLLSPEKIETLTLKQYTDIVAGSLLYGEQLKDTIYQPALTRKEVEVISREQGIWDVSLAQSTLGRLTKREGAWYDLNSTQQEPVGRTKEEAISSVIARYNAISNDSFQDETIVEAQQEALKIQSPEERLAPNGAKSNLSENQWKLVRTEAFKNWFGDWENDPSNASMALDENGEPKVYYTGTSKDVEFNTFKVPSSGVWFTDNPNIASEYAFENDSQKEVWERGQFRSINMSPRVYPVFLNIRKVAVADKNIYDVPNRGYKSIHATYFNSLRNSPESYDAVDFNGDKGTIVILGSPTQIKSAIGNKGTYSVTNGNIKTHIEVYHGSPHIYDRFDLSKVGAGEGVQAKGWGLYFTSSEAIARYYRDRLTYASSDKIGNVPVSEYYTRLERRADKASGEEADILYGKLGFLELLDGSRNFDESLQRMEENEYYNEISRWAENEIKPNYKPAGAIYKAVLHKGKSPSEYTYMRWEDTVSDDVASKVLAQAEDEIPDQVDDIKDALGLSDAYYGEPTYGSSLYSLLSGILGSDKEASLFLLRAGVDGISYDAIEENAVEGDTNYVVFDAKAASLIERAQFQVIFDENAVVNNIAYQFQVDSRQVLLNEAEGLIPSITSIYKNVFEMDLEGALKEIAYQANSSAAERRGAESAVGARMVEIALELYPNERPDTNIQFMLGEASMQDIDEEKAQPSLPEATIKRQRSTFEQMSDIVSKNNLIDELTEKTSELFKAVQRVNTANFKKVSSAKGSILGTLTNIRNNEDRIRGLLNSIGVTSKLMRDFSAEFSNIIKEVQDPNAKLASSFNIYKITKSFTDTINVIRELKSEFELVEPQFRDDYFSLNKILSETISDYDKIQRGFIKMLLPEISDILSSSADLYGEIANQKQTIESQIDELKGKKQNASQRESAIIDKKIKALQEKLNELPTKEKIADALKGNAEDINSLVYGVVSRADSTSTLVQAIQGIASRANFVNNQRTQNNANEFDSQLKKFKKNTGRDTSNVEKLYEGFVKQMTVTKYNEDGTTTEFQQDVLLNEASPEFFTDRDRLVKRVEFIKGQLGKEKDEQKRKELFRERDKAELELNDFILKYTDVKLPKEHFEIERLLKEPIKDGVTVNEFTNNIFQKVIKTSESLSNSLYEPLIKENANKLSYFKRVLDTYLAGLNAPQDSLEYQVAKRLQQAIALQNKIGSFNITQEATGAFKNSLDWQIKKFKKNQDDVYIFDWIQKHANLNNETNIESLVTLFEEVDARNNTSTTDAFLALQEELDKYRDENGLINGNKVTNTVLIKAMDNVVMQGLEEISPNEFAVVTTPYYKEIYADKLNELVQTIKSSYKTEEEARLAANQLIKQTEWYQQNHINDRPLSIWTSIFSTEVDNLSLYTPSTAYASYALYDEYKQKGRTEINGKYYINSDKNNKYRDKDYDAVKKDPAKLEFLDWYTNKYFEAQNNYGETSRMGYLMPSVRKSGVERLENPLDAAKRLYKDTSSNEQTKEELYGGVNKIPVRYSGEIESKDQSKDMIGSLLLYTHHANKFSELRAIEPILVGARDMIEANGTMDSSYSKSGIFNTITGVWAAIKGEQASSKTSVPKVGTSNTVKQLDNLIQEELYGKYNDEFMIPVLGGTDANTVSKSVMRLSSFGTFAMNAISPIKNAVGGLSQTVIFSQGVKNGAYSYGDIAKAAQTFLMHHGDFIQDFSKFGNKSLMGQMLDKLGLLQGEITDEFGKKTQFSALKEASTLSFLTYFKNYSEFAIQVQQALAFLHAKKVNHNGKMISLVDAWELDADGKIKLKDGVDFDKKEEFAFSQKVRYYQRAMNGAYRKEERNTLQRNGFGKLLFFMNQYFVPMWNARFRPEYYNIQKGNFEQGFHRFTASFIIDVIKDYHFNVIKAWKDLSNNEKQAVYSTLKELGIILSLSLAASAMGMGDAERRKKNTSLENLILATLIGSYAESRSFVWPSDYYNKINNPFFAFRPVSTMISLAQDSGYLLVGSEDAYFKRDAGYWDKGDVKALADALKLVGFTGAQLDPEYLAKNVETALRLRN